MKYWIIPCNVKTYDAIGAFNELKLIDWKQSKNLKSAKINDIVMIYLSKPFSCVKYICKIKKVNEMWRDYIYEILDYTLQYHMMFIECLINHFQLLMI